MDAVIYTKSIPEYEMLSGILADELSDVTVSRGVIDREYHLEREYDVVVVGINGAQGMELVCKYRELYGNTLVIWITDDPYFAREAIRTHSFDFIVRPLEETRFREPLRRIKEGDIAIWQRWSVKAPVYQDILEPVHGVARRRRKIAFVNRVPRNQVHHAIASRQQFGQFFRVFGRRVIQNGFVRVILFPQ